MSINDPHDPNDNRPRVERPRVEPEIIPPGGSSRGRAGGRGAFGSGGFESLFIGIEEGPDGIRRVTLKRPGPFTIIALVAAAGIAVALFFVLLAGLMILWVPLAIIGILIAMFSGQGRSLWQRMRGWLGGVSR